LQLAVKLSGVTRPRGTAARSVKSSYEKDSRPLSSTQLLVAEDVFVHHFGNRTFRALGIDTREQLVSNFERFKNKCGRERAAGYRLVGAEDN